VLFPAVVQLSGRSLDASLGEQHADEAKQLAHLRSLVRHLQQLEADGGTGDGLSSAEVHPPPPASRPTAAMWERAPRAAEVEWMRRVALRRPIVLTSGAP
jgi:hypothetical protein